MIDQDKFDVWRSLAYLARDHPATVVREVTDELAETVLVLLGEVERLRGVVAYTEGERDAEEDHQMRLVEASNGLVSALKRVDFLFNDLMNMENLHVYEPTAAIVTAALARWEAASGA